MGAFVNGIAIKGEKEFRILEAEEAEQRARKISLEKKKPVLSAYIYDGDYWGYTLYIDGNVQDEFATIPEYFEDGEERIRQYTADVLLLSRAFAIDAVQIEKYLYHWTDVMIDEGETAYINDEFPYGNVWQMVDFLRALGFEYPENMLQLEEAVQMPLPTLCEILDNEMPSDKGETTEYQMIGGLPSAFSYDYIRRLLEEKGIREFQFMDKNPQEIIDIVSKYCLSVKLSEKDIVCQHLNVLAAFCSYWFWARSDVDVWRISVWRFLESATYEPVVIKHEKPTDIYLLRARASVADASKSHRAIKDLERLIELDVENAEIYQEEIRKWEAR